MNALIIKSAGRVVTLSNIRESNVYPTPNPETLDWIFNVLTEKYWPGNRSYKVVRMATYQYKLVATEDEADRFWPLEILRLFLKDAMVGEREIEEAMAS